MIRIVLFLFAVGILALGIAWLADRPGAVTVLWGGWRIETSVMVAIFAVAMLTALLVFLWSLLRAAMRAPDLFALFLRNRRGAKGYLAISRGLIAIGSGDSHAARKHAHDARRLAPGEPLALLLSAQAAQLSGDRKAAEGAFAEMARRTDTKLLGLRGLFVEAQRRDDMTAARAYAEEAAKISPSPGWAGQAVLEFRCAAGDWAGALDALDKNMRSGLLDRPAYRRQRAVLLTARALSIEETDRETANNLVLAALKLEPTLIPAAALAGRLLAEAGSLRKAGRILEKAWKATPHPELADAYVHLRFGDSARDRLTRAEALAQKAPGHPEAALAVARAALDAREFERARAALAPLLTNPTRRVTLLMAEIEEVEHGDDGRAREWMARAVYAARDPAWTADGLVSERWLPVSPVSGRLDAFQWKVPLAELAAPEVNAIAHALAPRAVIEAAPPPKLAVQEPSEPKAATLPPESTPAPAAPARAASAAKRPRKPKAEAVIPLVHVPDDPGPEAEPEQEPVPEQNADNWNKLGRIFK
ncbi:MAG: HemY protein [Alphaproteobacteria bacterium]|jgi:HemY protein|nr:HemY protein [Alphaproteobacteria bacterium]